MLWVFTDYKLPSLENMTNNISTKSDILNLALFVWIKKYKRINLGRDLAISANYSV